MSTAKQLRNGIERYINEEIISKLPSGKQFILALGVGAFLSKIVDDMDIEPLYHQMKRRFSQQPQVTITPEDLAGFSPTIAMMLQGTIGNMTIRESDADKLYRYITEQ